MGTPSSGQDTKQAIARAERHTLMMQLLQELDWSIFRGTRPAHFATVGPHCRATREVLGMPTISIRDAKAAATMKLRDWANVLDCHPDDVVALLKTRGKAKLLITTIPKRPKRGRPPGSRTVDRKPTHGR